jgi:hypothetical protein
VIITIFVGICFFFYLVINNTVFNKLKIKYALPPLNVY